MAAGKRYGFDSYIGCGKETTWGTPVTRTKFQEILAESGGHKPNRTPIPTWRARIVPGHFDQAVRSGKTYGVPLTYENLLEYIRNLFWATGSNYAFATLGGAPAANTHTFKIGTAKPASLTIEGAGTDASGTGAFIYPGSYISKGVFEFAANDISKFTFDFVAKGETTGTRSAGPTIAPVSLFLKPGSFSIVLDADSGSQLELDQCTVTITPGIDEGRGKLRGTTDIVEPEPTGRADITVSFARDFNAISMYTKLISAASASLQIVSTGGIISGANAYKLDMLIPQFVVLGDSPAHTGPGIVPESINGQAQDNATNSACKLIITNTEATLT